MSRAILIYALFTRPVLTNESDLLVKIYEPNYRIATLYMVYRSRLSLILWYLLSVTLIGQLYIFYLMVYQLDVSIYMYRIMLKG